LRLTVLDAGGGVRAGASLADSGSPASARRFPLLFFDPTLIDLDPPADLNTEWWTGEAAVVDEHAILAARAGARVTLLVASVSALFLAGGLALAARAASERVRLTDMRSDFIAAVTHDLKTPVATIRAIAESFQRRATVDQSTRHDYGEIVLQEVKRLTRLIDNLLAYARISDVTEIYGFRRTSLALLVRNCLKQFAFRLETSGFEVLTDLPEDLPPIWADAPALSLALDNVIDNAIRYSDDRRVLTLRATPGARTVELEIIDAGIGISPADIDHVGGGFFRASRTTASGSGLGLAIAQRILEGHSGSLSIKSEVGVGTTVGITLPTAEDVSDDAHPDC
jgi:signal transduction histidine kinase